MIGGRNNLRYAEDTTLAEESEEKLMGLLRVEEESQRAGLKLNTKALRSSHPAPLLHGE